MSPVQIVLPEFLTAANLDSVMEEGLYIVLLFNFFESFAILTFCNFLRKVASLRLPFDEAQLEIPDQDKSDPFEKQPQGFINNNPAKNNPNVRGGSGGNRGSSGVRGGSGSKGGSGRKQQSGGRGRSKSGPRSSPLRKTANQRQQGGSRKSGGGGSCPGGSVDSCVGACDAIAKVQAYTACVKTCGIRC